MAHGVDLGRPRRQVAGAHPFGQGPPGGGVGHAGHRHHGVRGAAAVCEVQVPQQPGVVGFPQLLHPALTKGRLEGVLFRPGDLMHLVDEQQVGLPSPAPARPGQCPRRAR